MASGIWTSRDSDKTQKLVLEKAYQVGSNRQPPEFEQDFNTITTDKRRSFATWEPYAGLGTLEMKPEGAAPSYDAPFELIPYTATFATWALGVKATEEGELEDPENIAGKIPAMLAKSSRFTIDLTVYQAYNLAFDSRVPMSDGQPLCSTAHLVGPVATPTGVVGLYGTASNSIGATALTPESLEQMKILMRTLVDDRGMPDKYTYVDLMVPEQMDKIAREITGSNLAPYTSDNTKNVQQGVVSVRCNRYLTNPNAFFLRAGKGDPFSSDDCHGLFIAFKWRDKFKAWRDDETGNYNQKTSTRMTYGVAKWRGIVGSQGSTGNV